MWDLKHISVHALYSQEKKNYVLWMWDNKYFWFKYKIKWRDGLKN